MSGGGLCVLSFLSGGSGAAFFTFHHARCGGEGFSFLSETCYAIRKSAGEWTMLYKMCRICSSSAGWHHPAPSVGKVSGHKARYGFGFEEWLARREWTLSGYPGLEGDWRYGHIPSLLTRSHAHSGRQAKVLLFVYEIGLSLAVGWLEEAFVLSREEAAWAWRQYEELGQLDIMRGEVKQIRGDVAGLPPARTEEPIFFLDVRFRPDALHFFARPRPIPDRTHPHPEPLRLWRFNTAYDWDGILPA